MSPEEVAAALHALDGVPDAQDRRRRQEQLLDSVATTVAMLAVERLEEMRGSTIKFGNQKANGEIKLAASIIPLESRLHYRCFTPEFIEATLDLARDYRDTPAFAASWHPEDWIEQSPIWPSARFLAWEKDRANRPPTDKERFLYLLALTVREMLFVLDEAGLPRSAPTADVVEQFGGLQKLWDTADSELWRKIRNRGKAA
jgi:hypothetical protein